MKNAWDDMKKAKEDQYFKQEEQKIIQEKHEELETEELKSHYTGHCPKCGRKMTDEVFHGVNISRCHPCKGMWLEEWELKVLEHEEAAKSWFQKIWDNR